MGGARPLRHGGARGSVRDPVVGVQIWPPPNDAMINGGGSASLFQPSLPRAASMPARAPSSLEHGKLCGLCDMGEHVEPREIRQHADLAKLAISCGHGRQMKTYHSSTKERFRARNR